MGRIILFLKKPLALFISAFLMLVTFAVFYYLIVRWKYPQIAERGLFGDTFGLFNAIFSGLAFAGVIYTIIIQQREIESNTYSQHKDRFESTFFKLLELQLTITNALKKTVFDIGTTTKPSSTAKEITKVGREVVEDELNVLKTQFIGTSYKPSADFASLYESFDDQTKHQFDRYLTNIDTINDFILSSSLSDDDKKFYVKLFALQLDENELAFYFYYHTLSNGRKYQGGTEPSNGLDIIQFTRDDYLGHTTHLEFYYSKEYLIKNKHYDGDEYKLPDISDFEDKS